MESNAADQLVRVQRVVSLRLTIQELKLLRTEMEANVANCDDNELNAEYKRIFEKCQALLVQEMVRAEQANDDLSRSGSKKGI